MMRNKKISKFCIFSVVFIFLCSYFTYYTGYYEYRLANMRDLTSAQIAQFEKDVKEGRNIDIHDYLENHSVDYSNQLTRKTSQANIKLNEYLKTAISNSFKIFDKLFR